MPRVLCAGVCAAYLFLFTGGMASADLLMTAGGASFNFDTDGSGDFSLMRSGFPDVLEGFEFHIRTLYGPPGSEVESIFSFGGGSGLTIQSATSTSPSSGQIVFNSVLVPGSGNPSPTADLLIPILNFGLSEAGNGDALLQFTVTTIGLNFTDLGGLGTSSLSIDTFAVFDYESDSTEVAGVSNIPAYAGSPAISGDSSGSKIVFLQGDASAVKISSVTDLNSDILTGNDFTSGGSTSGDLSGGFQFSETFSSTSFSSVYTASVVAVPEPSASVAFISVLLGGLGLLGFDAQRTRRKRARQ